MPIKWDLLFERSRRLRQNQSFLGQSDKRPSTRSLCECCLYTCRMTKCDIDAIDQINA